VHLYHGSQTRGPPAACGPRNYFVRPSAMSTKFKIFLIIATCIIHFTRNSIIRLTYMCVDRNLSDELTAVVLSVMMGTIVSGRFVTMGKVT